MNYSHDPLVYELRSGKAGDEFVEIILPFKIINNKILLPELPDKETKVRVTGYNELLNANDVILANQYYVNYLTGEVYFNPNEEGKTVSARFYGRGLVYIPASRIYTKTKNGNVVETLGEIIENAENAIEIIEQVEGVIHDAVQATQENIQATQNANTAAQAAHTAKDDANVATTNANNAAASANLAAALANTAKESTTIATEEANQAAIYAKNMGDYAKLRGEETEVIAHNTEALRVTVQENETERLSKENERIAAEAIRASNEAGRVDAESTRSNAETIRISDETARQTKENERASAEELRLENEEARDTAEDTRQANETTRMSNEAIRQSQEQHRQTNTIQAISNAEAVTTSLNRLINNTKGYGEFNINTTYEANNIVTYNGSSYLALTEVIGIIPSIHANEWQLLAQRGIDGTGSVSSVAGKLPDLSGNVSLSANDIGLGNVTNESKATMFTSPAFTQIPTAPTADKGSNSDQLATTAFVRNAVGNRAELLTEAKSNVVDAVNELHTGMSNIDVIPPDGSITDVKIGTRTIVDTITAAAEADTPTRLLSKLGNMIKAITGKANWYTAPAKSIEQLIADNANRDGYGITAGTGAAYTVTLTPAPTLVDGLRVTVKLHAANTGTATLNINGLGAKSILKPNGGVLSAGNLKINSVYSLVYNGTNFILQGEGGEYGTAAATDVLEGRTIGTEAGVVTGTMPNRGGLQNATGTAQWGDGALAAYIPAGYYGNGNSGGAEVRVATAQLQAADADFIPSNFLATANVYGMQGTIPLRGGEEYPGWRRAEMGISYGYSGRVHLRVPLGAYINGGGNGEGYMGIFADDPNYDSANIRAGVNIFGMTGSLIQGKRVVTGTAVVPGYGATFTDQAGNPIFAAYVNITGHGFVVGSAIIHTKQTDGIFNYTVYRKNHSFFTIPAGAWANIMVTRGKFFGNNGNNYVFFYRGELNSFINNGTTFQIPAYDNDMTVYYELHEE